MFPERARRSLSALALVVLGALVGVCVGCGEDDPVGPLPGKAHVRVPEDYPDLETAIAAWNFGDTISLAPGTHSGAGFRNLGLEGQFVAVVGRDPANPSRIDLEMAGQGFAVRDGSTLYLRDLVFQRGLAGVAGALRVTESSAWLERVRIEDCAARYGGAIVVERSDLTARNCEFVGNEALEVDAGAIYATLSEVELSNTMVTGNRAHATGGAVSMDRTQFKAVSSTFAGNVAATGGAFRVARTSDLQLVHSIVWRNEAEDGSDPALVASSASIRLVCCAIDTLEVSGVITSAENVISIDPGFCEPTPPVESPTTFGDYGIVEGSPCAPENTPCGVRVGARDPGCGRGGRGGS